MLQAVSDVFFGITHGCGPDRELPITCFGSTACIRSLVSLCHQAWASLRPLTLEGAASDMENGAWFEQRLGRLGPHGRMLWLDDRSSDILGKAAPRYFWRLADVVCHCCCGDDIGDMRGPEAECLRVSVMGALLAMARTLTLLQLNWQYFSKHRLDVPSIHMSYISHTLERLAHHLRTCYSWRLAWAADATAAARDSEQELLRDLHNLAWSVLLLRERGSNGCCIQNATAALERAHSYAADILQHLQGALRRPQSAGAAAGAGA